MFAFKFNLKFNFRSINCLSLRSFGGVSATTQSHSVRALVQNRFVIVETMSKHDATQGNQLRFPLVWLRDNCQCGECFHAFSMSRTIDWTTFDFTKAQPKKVSVSNSCFYFDILHFIFIVCSFHAQIEDGLKITWGDSHESVFRLDWLNERNFSTEKRNNYLQNVYKPQPLLWSKDNLPLEQFHYGDIMDSNGSLAAWLKSLAINGVTLIKNAPLDENVCRNLAERVGFIRKTHYGEEFIVKAKENTSNVAYLSSPLQMHTDLPYYDYKPGVNLLHCIVQSTSPGAFNLLTDGFYVAERMRSECPQSYETLTQTLVNWSDYGEEDGNRFQKINRSPVIW